MRLFLVLIAHFFILLQLNAQTCHQLEGRWQNRKGSILSIESLSSSGRITGSYLSHEGTDAVPFPLIGWAQKDTTLRPVSFTVHWKENGTLTSWTGYCDARDTVIYTLWHHIDPTRELIYQRWSTQASEFMPYPQERKHD